MLYNKIELNPDYEGPFTPRELLGSLGLAALGVLAAYTVVVLLMLPVVRV